MSTSGGNESSTGAYDGVDAAKLPFLLALDKHIEEGHANGSSLAVLVIECGVIDRIDAVWGYHIGDAVRARVIAALRAEVLRPNDLVDAMGRDDLVCVLSPVDGPEVALLAAEKSLRTLNIPFWIGDEEIFADPAIGIAICPNDGNEAQSLLQRAKIAGVIARTLTRRISVYEEGHENPEASRLIYENQLRSVVVEDSLELVFQPQYDLRLGQIMGAEGKLVWRDATRGVVPAEDAYAAAESAGVVAELVSSVLNRTLRNCSEFRYAGGLDLRVGVNIPGRVLLHTELPDVVERAINTWSLRPGRLVLEISDTAILSASAVARETLGRLKNLGVKLSIDDSNLALLSLFEISSLPFQEIKINLSGISESTDGPKSERILKSLIELAHQLRLDIVAVGVSDEAAATQLKALGCDYMQADYKGPALDPESFVSRYGFGEQ